MTLKANLQGTGASYGHSEALCGELAPNVTAAGSTQATATLLRRLTRHIVTSGTGGIIVPPGVGLGDRLQDGDEIEITNATLAAISVYPPTGTLFLGSLANAAITLDPQYSMSVLVDSSTRMIARYYQTGSGIPGSGTVTSVGLALPSSILTVSGSPVTTAGTLTGTLATQTANYVWAGPTTGSAAQPTFRPLVAADIPSLTSGTSILYGNGSGGFSNVTIGTGLSFGGGTLSSTIAGSVTSVGLSAPAIFTVSGSPVTTTGTLAFSLANQNANLIWAGPGTGSPAAPTFRAMVAADLPNTAVTPGTYNITTLTVDAQGRLTAASTGALTGDVTTSALAATVKANLKTADIAFVIDGGGSAITTGIKGDLQINFNCTIQANTILLDQSGSIVIDIWKDTYANYPPTGGDSITASAKPTVSGAVKSTDSTLTGWTTSITAGDTLRFNVDSITTATRALIDLKVIKT